MYSANNSYLGGINGQYSGQQQQQQQPPQLQSQYGQPSYQQQGLVPQPTGYALQPQQTGYPVQQQQQQQQPMMPQYNGFPTSPASYQPPPQPQQQQQQPVPQQSAPFQLSMKTGMTSSQVADSFRSSAAAPTQQSTRSNKIPNVRLSFITADDQSKFETLFRSAVGDEQALSGDKARDILLRSRLPGDALSQIWSVFRMTTRCKG